MSLSLGDKQRLFASLISRLIVWAEQQGYRITFGYTYRSPEENGRIGGHPRSTHMKKLAADLNLFRKNENGRWVYLTSSESHRQLGEHWESMHPLCRWGGRFNDGNHYSLEHDGVK